MPSSTASTRAGPKHVTERQRTFRIIEAELDRGVDVGGRRDPQFGDAGADIDDHGEQPLHHEAGAVVDHGDRRAGRPTVRRPRHPSVSGVVSGVFISVRRPLKRPSISTATVRAGSSLRRTAALDASSPSGVTKTERAGAGRAAELRLHAGRFQQLRQARCRHLRPRPRPTSASAARRRVTVGALPPARRSSRRSPASSCGRASPPATRTAICAEG